MSALLLLRVALDAEESRKRSMALLFGSFLCIRRQRWVWAATLAALASVVRPLGVFALLSIGVILLFQRQYHRALACTAAVPRRCRLFLVVFLVRIWRLNACERLIVPPERILKRLAALRLFFSLGIALLLALIWRLVAPAERLKPRHHLF